MACSNTRGGRPDLRLARFCIESCHHRTNRLGSHKSKYVRTSLRYPYRKWQLTRARVARHQIRRNCAYLFSGPFHQRSESSNSPVSTRGNMKHHRLDHFSEVWVIDFEFFAPPGERPRPICMVGREYFSGRIEKLWFEGSEPAYPALPFSTGLLGRFLFLASY